MAFNTISFVGSMDYAANILTTGVGRLRLVSGSGTDSGTALLGCYRGTDTCFTGCSSERGLSVRLVTAYLTTTRVIGVISIDKRYQGLLFSFVVLVPTKPSRESGGDIARQLRREAKTGTWRIVVRAFLSLSTKRVMSCVQGRGSGYGGYCT